MTMHIFHTKAEVRAYVASARDAHKTIGFVPTMGALHEGHLTLMRKALAGNDLVIASIFVNPTQFGPDEDYSSYPRSADADCELLASEGVSAVFIPTAGEMYDTTIEALNASDGELSRTSVVPGPLSKLFEGALRPIHFAGVCLVLSKFFNIVQPDRAYFGEKDYQQLAIVRQMVADLDMPLEIVGCPIARDESGLALSSRNRYFDEAQRAKAGVLYQAILLAQNCCAQGIVDCGEIVRDVIDYLTKQCGDTLKIGYVAIVESATLEEIDTVGDNARLLISVQLEGVHLIDNAQLCL